MRLFFAMWPDRDTAARLSIAADTLGVSAGTRLVPRENYHLTLVFVGEVADSQVAMLQTIGRELWAASCSIKLDAYEYWPEPQVVVATAREISPALHELCIQLQRALVGRQPRTHAHAQRPQRPHVTLARKVTQPPVLQAMSVLQWTARHFSLVRSDTGGTRSVYTVVDTWPLLDETAKP